jgi:hypothetical protein
MRQLTKSESIELEDLKIQVLGNLEPMTQITDDAIFNALDSSQKTPLDFKNTLKADQISPDTMTMGAYKKAVVAAFVEHFFS